MGDLTTDYGFYNYDPTSGYNATLGALGNNAFASSVQDGLSAYQVPNTLWGQAQAYGNTALYNLQNWGSQAGNAISNGWNSMANTTLGQQIGNMSALDKIQGAAGLLQAGASMYNGWNQSKLQQQAYKDMQNNWNKQWSANVKTTNAALADRQAARVASNPTAYQSVDSYMKQYGIS